MKHTVERQECGRALVHKNLQTLPYLPLVWALSPRLIITRGPGLAYSAVPGVVLEGERPG